MNTKIEEVSVRIKHHKCFGETAEGFDKIKRINIVIGRNNAGKSALLDVLEFVTHNRSLEDSSGKGRVPEIQISKIIRKKDFVKSNVREDQHLETIQGYRMLKDFEGCEMTFSVVGDNVQIDSVKEIKSDEILVNVNKGQQNFIHPASEIHRALHRYKIARLASERDLSAEKLLLPVLIQPNGSGATSLISHIVHEEKEPREIVEKDILLDINTIFSTDGSFARICPQLLKDTGHWEIYLQHKNSNSLVPIRNSGSGLKTILLVVSMFHLYPKYCAKKEASDCLFIFEDLENNMHPALQRNLLTYIEKKAKELNTHVFLSTHSNVCIDLFASNKDAQILRVYNEEKITKASQVKNYIEKVQILDELGVRASDILQANGIVWVEGPSDKVYLKKWIELWSEGKLLEPNDYQIMFYGGSLLAQVSGEPPEPEEKEFTDKVNLLLINRNSAIVVDSDKEESSAELKPRAKRIETEFQKQDNFVWISCGREIENYIPDTILQKEAFDESSNLPTLGRYEKIDQFFINNSSKKYKSDFSSKKIKLAKQCSEVTSRKNLEDRYDLATKLENLCDIIAKWNGK